MTRHVQWMLCVFAIAFPLMVHAWGGPTKYLLLAPGPGASEENTRKAFDFLRTEAGFISGSFINEHKYMKFAGPTETIAEVIRVLTTDACLNVTVKFAHIDNPDVSFAIAQNTTKLTTGLIVNLDCPQLDLTKLVITTLGEQDENRKEDIQVPFL